MRRKGDLFKKEVIYVDQKLMKEFLKKELKITLANKGSL